MCKIKIITLGELTDTKQPNNILINVYVCAVLVCVRVCVNLCHVCLRSEAPRRTKVSFDMERKASGGRED